MTMLPQKANAKGKIRSTLIFETEGISVRRLRWTRVCNGKRYEGSKAVVVSR